MDLLEERFRVAGDLVDSAESVILQVLSHFGRPEFDLGTRRTVANCRGSGAQAICLFRCARFVLTAGFAQWYKLYHDKAYR
jgi:hypothetical protein